MRPASFLAPVLGLVAFAAAQAPEASISAGTPSQRGCGTARAVQARISAEGVPGGPSARTAATAALRGRTLYTPHFAIHYSVNKTVHQVAWHAADSTLLRLRDSLLTVFLNADPLLRDSLLHDRLDSLGAPHPTYAQKAAHYFENARAHYGDTLGMLLPDSNRSENFQRPSRGRFSVDIVDISTIEPGYTETYGLTNVPSGVYASPMLVENDFRYVTTPGSASLLPIIARHADGTVIHDYSQEWDYGLAVTIAHEYYHAVQFRYTANLITQGYHAWYELSATGMEDRLAPQVNDYLQYLRHVIPYTGTVSLLTPPQSLQNYGNGIFHLYLTHVLGKTFDVALWERLRTNGNKLPDALLTAFGSEARWDSLYTGYAAAIAISGRPGAGASPLAFSPDMGLWPRPPLDSAAAKPVTTFSLKPLTFRLVQPTASGTTWASLPGMRGGWRLSEDGLNYSAGFLADSALPVTPGAFAVTVANASPTQTRLMKLSRAAAGVSAYPNPARAGGSVAFNADGAGTGATLTVVSESGKRVARIVLGATDASWAWDLRDDAGRAVPPGVYYFGAAGAAPQALLLLP